MHIPTGLYVNCIHITTPHHVLYFLNKKEVQFSKYAIMDLYTTCYQFEYIIDSDRTKIEECYKSEFEVMEI